VTGFLICAPAFLRFFQDEKLDTYIGTILSGHACFLRSARDATLFPASAKEHTPRDEKMIADA